MRGGRMAHPHPVPAKLPQLRDHEGAYKLTVSFAAWRLQSSKGILTTWDDAGRNDDERVRCLRMMTHQRIARARVIAPAWDLTLGFGGGLVLRVFPLSSSRTDTLEYPLSTPHAVFMVKSGGEVKTAARRPSRWPGIPSSEKGASAPA